MTNARWFIAYAILNAVLYSLLLPLWEGFDEPFHFGYVQQLANGQGVPDPRASHLSQEVGNSMLAAPVSPLVQRNLPGLRSFSEYFARPVKERVSARRELWGIPSELRWQPAPFLNYEGQQAPLAYGLLALPERALAGVPLLARVAILRIIGAVAGSLLLFWGAQRLFQQIELRDPYRAAATFCVLSCQMTWATLAHVSNDWLAVPVAVWTLVALIHYQMKPGAGAAAAMAGVLSIGLLTKAYFLAFVPLVFGLCIWRRRWRDLTIAALVVCLLAGPWYVRNVRRYGALLATLDARAGVGVESVAQEAGSVAWMRFIPSSIRRALWTGNNSYLTFSDNTLNLTILAGLALLLLWAATRHRDSEWVTFLYCASFAVALGYAAVSIQLFTHRVVTDAAPWYAQVLSAPLSGLVMLGASRWRTIGRTLAAALVILFAYTLSATYVVKLIPLYGGYEGRTSLRGVALLYAQDWKALTENLGTVTLGPPAVIYALTAATIAMAVALGIRIGIILLAGGDHHILPGGIQSRDT